MPKPCMVNECTGRLLARGLCNKHYQRWRKYGDPLKVLARAGNSKPRPVPETRVCRDCGFTGPRAEFRPYTNHCKPCSNAYKERWKKKNPDKVAASMARQAERLARYELRRRARRNGLDQDEVEKYYNGHDGRCEICGHQPGPGQRDLNMDHDHETGQFRGMLCDNCNGGIGRFKDDIARLKSAIAYLERHGALEGVQ